MTALFSLGQTKKDSLYVFVGEKIEVKEWPQPKTIESIDTTIVNGDTIISKRVSLSMDSRFIARYKILQQVYGTFKSDTIEFLAFDHYGTPAFSKYKYVMLFVTNYNGKLYHEKYQYFDVYKTKSGRWASSYKVGDYEHDYNKSTTVKPELIDFVKQVSYNIKGRSKEDIDYLFPSPYFKIVGQKAVAVWGNYVAQLFELKKGGILKARGIFD
ncbi:MAG: hypothetical protein QM802_22375 [Agriterribacter sp.]